jgi:DNA-binding PadR family transcriptional regulator
MGAVERQRPGEERADERSAGGHRLSLAEWLVLCLVRQEPTYGLDVAQQLGRDGSLGRIWFVQRGSVYLAVKRLEVLGLIRITGKQPAIKGGPDRTLLRATPAGRAAAQAWLSTPVEHARDVRSELMMKLALLDRAGSDSRVLVRVQLARLLPVAAALDDQLCVTTGFEHTLVLWRHGALTATIRFLEGLIAGRDEGLRAGTAGRRPSPNGAPAPAGRRRRPAGS